MAILAGSTVLGAAVGGCGDDAEPTSGSGDTTTSSTAGSGASGAGGAGECSESQINQDDACEVCAIDECYDLLLACCEVEGCLDIIRCAQETECTGVDCYMPDTCQTEIDAAGGIGVATEFASPLGDCVLAECTGCSTGGGGGAGGTAATGGAGGN